MKCQLLYIALQLSIFLCICVKGNSAFTANLTFTVANTSTGIETPRPSLDMRCSWTSTMAPDRGTRISFYRDHIELDKEIFAFSLTGNWTRNQTNSVLRQSALWDERRMRVEWPVREKSVIFRLNRLVCDDSGIYVCVVELMKHNITQERKIALKWLDVELYQAPNVNPCSNDSQLNLAGFMGDYMFDNEDSGLVSTEKPGREVTEINDDDDDQDVDDASPLSKILGKLVDGLKGFAKKYGINFNVLALLAMVCVFFIIVIMCTMFNLLMSSLRGGLRDRDGLASNDEIIAAAVKKLAHEKKHKSHGGHKSHGHHYTKEDTEEDSDEDELTSVGDVDGSDESNMETSTTSKPKLPSLGITPEPSSSYAEYISSSQMNSPVEKSYTYHIPKVRIRTPVDSNLGTPTGSEEDLFYLRNHEREINKHKHKLFPIQSKPKNKESKSKK